MDTSGITCPQYKYFQVDFRNEAKEYSMITMIKFDALSSKSQALHKLNYVPLTYYHCYEYVMMS